MLYLVKPLISFWCGNPHENPSPQMRNWIVIDAY